MSDPIENFRQTVRKLKATGADGFEGLMAAVLTDLTKRSFTLASAGSQHGIDGQSALDGGTIVFEAKRYDSDIPKDKIYTKIFEIAGGENSAIELYVLAATSPISAQYISAMEQECRQFRTGLLVLAWPETGLAELAALLAMTPDVTTKFIAAHTPVGETEIVSQLTAVRSHPQFAARSDELMTALQQPSIAPAYALKDNIAWLSGTFSNKQRARSAFGQALCPEDPSIPGIIDRTDLRTKVATTIFAKPDGAITAILGADGNGKSWIFAQAWSRQRNPPLTVVIVPGDIDTHRSVEACQELLIRKLLTQTGETPSNDARERWLKHFKRWQTNTGPNAPRLVVFIDGVNQRERVDWLWFMNAMTQVVDELGGRLVFSCRRLIYRDNFENRLDSRIVKIEVPDWNDDELEGLLQLHGTSVAALGREIVCTLRNPRIFGVAAALFKAKKITTFVELSVSRLLFEHIQSGTAVEGNAVTPKKFKADICNHAESIVQRLKTPENDGFDGSDMSTFTIAEGSNQTITQQFVIVSASRFYEVLDHDPNKYVLKDEGLSLALGLALVRAARAALHDKRSVDEALSNILDPIAALDRTGEILLGAVLAAVLETDPKDIVAPLVRSFVALQNLDSTRYPEFRHLFRHDPVSFLAALEDSALAPNVTSNLSWLSDAIDDLRGHAGFETAMDTAIHRWLNMYSTAPERLQLVPNHLAHSEERKKERAKREQQLSEAIASLSQPERSLLDGMIEENRGDYSRLSLIALRALAGRSLAPYAESLRNRCFAASLNDGYYLHHDDFYNLLHLNLVDWAATKKALREAAKLLREPGISSTGQWALVYVLRATGDSSDAQEADRLAEELNRDLPKVKGWPLIEDYCATDPCDPSSEQPDNIDRTAEKYRAINPAEVRRSMNNTRDDFFFITAQPGLARFRPDVAVEAIRALADQALTRPQAEFRQAVFLLENHTIALEDRIAAHYVEKAREITQAALDAGGDKNGEAWGAAQTALMVALPHMTGDAQFDALINHPNDKTILLDLGYLFQPIDEIKLEHALDKAVRENNPVAQFRVLCFAEYSRTPLTARTKEMVLKLLPSAHDHVRLSVLALTRATADPSLLAGLVKSEWSASRLDAVDHVVEILHGSQALVLATEQGMITVEACLDRIALSAYQELAEKLGAEATMAIADRLNTAIYKATEFQVTDTLPDIQQRFEDRHWSIFLQVSERPAPRGGPNTPSRNVGEIGDAWYERQRRRQEVADRFVRDLTKVGAQLIVRSVTLDLIGEIDKVAPAMVDRWRAFFIGLDRTPLNNVHNVALVVAEAVSKRDAAAGLALYERLRRGSPHTRVTFGREEFTLDTVIVWGAGDSEEIRALRYARLDKIGNDHDLAMEVLAAIRANRVCVLRDYVIDRRQRSEPAHRARAAMVAGLSPDEPWALETIDQLRSEHGFLHRAYEGAKYAMDRHQWTRHWAAKMRTATDPVELWRYSVLVSKIADGRFKWAEVEGTEPSPLIKRFGSTLDGLTRQRIGRWRGKRHSKLFGTGAPSKIFLPGGRSKD
jgi:hypothetical protein